jgi:hypothetical protein
MTIDRLRKTLQAQPFRPFRLHMGDGRSLRVSHPDFVWIPPEGSRTVIVSTGGDDFEIVDMMLVVSIEVGNGARRRRGR